MRRFLNKPIVVYPAALAALVFLLLRIGVLDKLDFSSFFKEEVTPLAESDTVKKVQEIEASRMAQLFKKERWLPANWQQYTNFKRELFVADYRIEDENLMPMEIAYVVDSETGEVEVNEEQLTSYIAKNTGLDRSGFFVRFGVIRKREGDGLKTKDGIALTLGKIAMPDQGQLNGNGDYRSIEDVINALSLEATSPIEAEEAESVVLDPKPVPEVYREGDIVSTAQLDRKPVRREYASAVILGGVSSRDIYREGDLVSRIPAIGLAGVREQSVELVDREGRIYELQLTR